MSEHQKISGIVLGHNALLSIAEVLSQMNNTTDVLAASQDALVAASDTDLVSIADHMGGVQKIATNMLECSLENITSHASQLLLHEAQYYTHKLPFAVSCYGTAEGMQRQLLKDLKRALKAARISGRFVHKEMHTNAPNVLIRNQVLGKGVDIVIIGARDRAYIGVTAWVQDVDTYALRDVEKPRRDMKTGMLPPKLAQTLINLTLPHVQKKGVPCVWDPFCGLGVIPMEVVMMGLPVVCSDINPKMEENTRVNLEWLTRAGDNVPSFGVSTLDVRHWAAVPTASGIHPDCIVTEGTLGLNFREPPTVEQARAEQAELMALYEDFFQGLTRPEAATIQAVTITIPFHITADGNYLRMVPTLLSTVYACGFTPVEVIPNHVEAFKKQGILNALTEEHTILYTRSKQFVGREILVLRRA